MANVMRSGMCPKSEEGLILTQVVVATKAQSLCFGSVFLAAGGVIKEPTDVYSDCLIGLGSEVHKTVESLEIAVPQHRRSSLLIYNIYNISCRSVNTLCNIR